MTPSPALIRAAAALALLLGSLPALATRQASTLASPDGRLTVSFGSDADARPTWALAAAGRRLLAPSVLGLEFERYAKLADGLTLARTERHDGIDAYDLPAGKVAHVAERFRELVLHYVEAGGLHRRLDVIARAYDSGVALRYRIPRQPALPKLRLVNELTEFAFPADYACHGLNLGSFGTSHEGEFDPVAASLIRAHHRYELPLVCETGTGGPAIAIAEAAVEDWPVMLLSGTETGRLGLAATLARRSDDPAVAVIRDVGVDVVSPWRVVMVAPDAGHLIESTLLTSLNPPARGDFSWVQAGKTAWDWWSGPSVTGIEPAGSDMRTERAFVDFAASLRLPYAIVDEGWYVHSGAGPTLLPGADPTRTVPAIDLPALVAYAQARGVGLFLWIHWALLDRDMDRLLDFVAASGAKGIKVDFLNRDDQAIVGFMHRLAAATARCHLLLDLHGATHPWGMTRTWPNLLTQESVLGAEYNKWTRRITARHNITLAYTRLLTGPMDYTPGGYRNRTPATFRIAATLPQTQTTRAAELAKYVVFESGLQTLADTPDAYRGQPGLDFLAAVPARWDETRFLAGTIGRDVALARRNGRRWYVGAMTDAAGALRLPLSFLGTGRYRLRTWEDGAGPTDLRQTTRLVTAADTLALVMAAAGGGAASLEPVP